MGLRAPQPVASLPRRLLGFLLDGFVLIPVYLVYAALFDTVFGPLVEPGAGGTALVVVAVSPGRIAVELTLTLLTDAAYYAGSWCRWGMTLGQRACGVRVHAVGSDVPPGPVGRRLPSPDPGRVPLPAAVSRWAVLQVPGLCVGTLGTSGAIPISVVASLNAAWFGLLFVTTAADPLLRGLHDRLAGTVVVRPAVGGRA